MMVKLAPQQIGKCGELLVQYMLLKHGVESAPLTTDPGIDLVAFPNVKASAEERRKPVTIQVKTSTQHGVPGDKWLEWWIPDNCPADCVAAVDLERQKCWLFSTNEFKHRGGRSGEGRRLWWYIPGQEYGRTKKTEETFKEFEMEAAIPKVFGIE